MAGVAPSPDVRERARAVEARIAAACARAGRDRRELTLVAASKRQPTEVLQAAWEAGVRVFGENRVQEAERKRDQLPETAQWHLFGPLQSNKVRRAAALFDVVHSLDRPKIASLLDREAARTGRLLLAFAEVNLGDEPSKHGFSPHDLAERLSPLARLDNLEVVGLMAIPPRSPQPEGSRPWFKMLGRLRDDVSAAWPEFRGLLSMGMSQDFEIAIEEGATHIRLGTVLLGPREGPGPERPK